MEPFKPYSINHIPITDVSGFPMAPAICYYWWQGIPLGHLWINADTRIDIAEYRKRVLTAVRPAIQYYVAVNRIENTTNWESLFLNSQKELFSRFLSDSLKPSLLNFDVEDNEPVSVVICTRNRAPFLEQCISSLMESTDMNFELIVVDNAPDDDSTKKVVAAFPIARYVPEPRKGLDIARNTGARNARHSIIAYADDDVIVDKEWIRKIKNCFSDPMTMSVTGQVIPISLKTKSQYIFERYWGFNKGYIPKVFDKQYFTSHLRNGVPAWDIGAGANMAFRKEIFDIAGFFDERLDVGAAGCSGDSEFWYRILAEGWNCFYCPQLFVYHQHRESEKALKNQVFHYMRGHVAALFVQYENYGHEGNLRRVYKLLPRYYLGLIKARLLRGRTEDHYNLITEIKGCISGWHFYRSVKANKRIDTPVYKSTLSEPVVITEKTLVSVIITCYNYGNYLRQAIGSVINQTYENIEIIVVDDGSTDNTQQVIKGYPGIKSVIAKRVGASAARNIGVSYSTGDLLVFLDADDYLYPDAVAVNCSYFATYPDCTFISGAYDRVNNAGEILANVDPQQHLGNNYVQLLQGNYIGMLGNTMYRRDLFYAFHFDTTLGNCEEYDLNLRISKYFPSFSHKHKITAYRIHENNKSRNKERMFQTIKKILDKHCQQAESEDVKKAIEQGIKNWENYYLKTDDAVSIK